MMGPCFAVAITPSVVFTNLLSHSREIIAVDQLLCDLRDALQDKSRGAAPCCV